MTKDFFKVLQEKGIKVPKNITLLLENCKSYQVFNTVDEIIDITLGDKESNSFEVKYDIPGKGVYTEAIVHRVSNGISANYTEAYMRRRDPNTMVIADNLPTDKERFADRFGYEFSKLEKETMDWLKNQDLGVFLYFAGRDNIGVGGIAIVPANAGFFAMGLAMLQQIVSLDKIPPRFNIGSAIFVAPTFRHTHFEGKQVVVHNRTTNVHEIYSYNLYPGPSAKKGLYAALLDEGEKGEWITAHCSAVEVYSPYDNRTTFMHEGASGGGKSEMLQNIIRETNGMVMLGKNLITGEERKINLPIFCEFNPVTDDMALCPPSIQSGNGKLTLTDAENAWFVRVDSVNAYGDDPFLEKVTINPPTPLLFLNLKSNPGGTVLIWAHTEDEPGKPCPNPRVVLPREIVRNVVSKPISVDVRSFGVRTPPTTKENPNFGIVGMFHILPPALAWLWRLTSPRGYANPSIVSDGTMGSEGVGSYWPFATGKRVTHANILLDQILHTTRTLYTLVPNQHIGAWKVGFKPQLLMREYLTRRGNARLKPEQYQDARCPLLGYELNYLTIEGAKIPSRFLKVYRQDEVGTEGYDAGAQILIDFFKRELPQYKSPALSKLGNDIIDACLSNASVSEYEAFIKVE